MPGACVIAATRFLFGDLHRIVIEGAGAGRRRGAYLRCGMFWRRMHMPFVRGYRLRGLIVMAAAVSVVAVGGCGSVPNLNPLSSKGKARAPSDNAAAIGVNGYLWRATL